ncbi:MAG TPA: SiaB family protein kinase [Methyloceanibacter sp.]|nr:SiaB family protein kinase [Methyloceanibacter sp.]
MLASQLMDLRAMLHSQGVIFAYSGYVTEPVLSGVGEALKQKLTIDDADTKTLRSVFAVFVEQMQNIIRYSAEKAQPASLPPASDAGALREIRYGILTIGKEGDDYVVCAGNLVERADVERLRARLNRIREMTKEELKAVYKEQLRAEPEEGSKGAGLGFMEIARRASKPLEFGFTGIDEKHAFFALKVTI